MSDVTRRRYGFYSTAPSRDQQLSRPEIARRGPLGERPARGEDTVPLAHSRAGRPQRQWGNGSRWTIKKRMYRWWGIPPGPPTILRHQDATVFTSYEGARAAFARGAV